MMNQKFGLLAVLALGVSLSACEHTIKMRGQVTEKMPVETTSPAEPVEGATVRLYCPENGDWRAIWEPMTTDASGHFRDEKIGGPELDCEYRVRSDAHKPASVSLEDVCVQIYEGKYCYETKADIELEPAEPTSN